MASPKSMPKDADDGTTPGGMAITEYEPRAINQMRKFAFRHVATVLDDAKMYSVHVRKAVLMQM